MVNSVTVSLQTKTPSHYLLLTVVKLRGLLASTSTVLVASRVSCHGFLRVMTFRVFAILHWRGDRDRRACRIHRSRIRPPKSGQVGIDRTRQVGSPTKPTVRPVVPGVRFPKTFEGPVRRP